MPRIRIQPGRILALLALLWAGQAMANSPTVRVSGGDDAVQDNIRAHISVSSEPCDLPAWRERAMLRNARQNADRGLRALGYYRAQIDARLERDNGCWRLLVDVEPGQRVIVREVNVRVTGEAEEDNAFRQIFVNRRIRENEPLIHSHYEDTKNLLVRTAADRGYFESRLREHRLEVDADAGEARIHLWLDSGPRYRFGSVTLEQDVLNDDLAYRFIPFTEGDYYDSRQLISLQQSLNASGYYASVRIDTDPDEEALRVPVHVTATPRARHGYMAGIGFSTDIGPRLRLGYENRRVNRRGHRYNTELEASPVRSGAGINYEIPLDDPNRERINLSSSFQQEETSTSESERYRVGVAYLRELRTGWIATTSLEYEREYFTIASQRDRTDLLMPGFELSRTRGNHPIYPTRGWTVSGKVRFAEEQALSSVSFIQVRGRAKAVMPFLGGRVLTRVEGGATEADEVIELPTSVRFFTGGDNTVRGYGYQRLGPRNDDGEVIGGRHMVASSIEYDYLFLPSWAVAVFVDAGNAYDTLNDFEALYGYGIGVRWRSPIGPIRIDVARPSDGRDPFRLHVSMGPDL
ncbi:autotransporter assembly complex protein TamA [Isoalcanivorax indicus]|uniref:autotransporter assembly complex protein TamA n=1 Tax=Isoalcanivorax indicus TaxID=2202653 RepID=UPI000DBAB235|nr:autotransporter assembly complex family protein [Isoalcanivorax indicus]